MYHANKIFKIITILNVPTGISNSDKAFSFTVQGGGTVFCIEILGVEVYILKIYVPLSLKAKIWMYVCSAPIIVYGAQTWTLLRKGQGKLSDGKKCFKTNQKTKLLLHIAQSFATRLKWNWTGQVPTMEQALKIRRQKKQWRDKINNFSGMMWLWLAQKRGA